MKEPLLKSDKFSEIRLPFNFQQYEETIMSNFDHEIDIIVQEAIKNKPFWSAYSGWNFYGKVWYQDNLWHCEVWTYQSYSETFSAETLEEIMSDICDNYGSE